MAYLLVMLASILSRLPILAGPVPGAESLVVHAVADAHYCGGKKVTVVAESSTAKLDPALVAALTIEFPHGLDFANDPKGSRQRFDDFARDATAKTQAVTSRREHDKSAEALARSVQVVRRFAEVVARAEIPDNVAAGSDAPEKIHDYCLAVSEVADALLDKADIMAEACRAAQTTKGWWTSVCGSKK
jgi:hypothetical protein